MSNIPKVTGDELREQIDGTKVVNEWQRGYNQALDNYHSNIRKLFEVEG